MQKHIPLGGYPGHDAPFRFPIFKTKFSGNFVVTNRTSEQFFLAKHLYLARGKDVDL
jgi:hypothetical protein